MSNHKGKVNIDLTGQKHGMLTVIKYFGRDKYKCKLWEVSCECGRVTTKRTSIVLSGVSCGCKRKSFFKDLSGIVVNGVEILSLHGKNKALAYTYNMKCHCGNIFVAEGNDLIGNKFKSCGCKSNAKLGYESREDAITKNLFISYKFSAKRRELAFEFTHEEFKSLIFSPCEYCGIVSSNSRKDRKSTTAVNYNGIDRVNNDLGYTKENAVPCCYDCNQAKHALTKDSFINWVKRIHSHLKTKGELI